MGLIIRSSAIHAAGCYTTTAIRKGARVAEYTGHELTKSRPTPPTRTRPSPTSLDSATAQIVIDGHSMAMFINHSCDPNCETSERRRPRLDHGHPEHRRRRRDHLRLLPLRRRRRRSHLQLRRAEVPRHHVLTGRDPPPQSRREESRSQGRKNGSRKTRRRHRKRRLIRSPDEHSPQLRQFGQAPI